MKKLTFFLFIATMAIFLSCNNSADEEMVEEDTIEIAPEVYLWTAEMTEGKLTMTKDRPAGLDSLAPGPIVEFLNQTNPNIRLEFVRSSGDTVFVKIPDATYLTQQMGSTGPTFYLAGVTYNLTEVPGTNFVSLDFEEGDHASPGVWSRQDFDRLRNEE